MATRRRLKPSSLQAYQNQRRFIIGLVSILFVSVVLFFILAYTQTEFDFLQTFVFIFLIIFVFVLFGLRQRMFSINMYFHYFRMIAEQQPPFSVSILPMNQSFIHELTKEGFTRGVDRPSHQIYFKHFRHLPFVKRTGPTMVWVILATHEEFNPYTEAIERDFEQIKLTLPQSTQVVNELTMVMRKLPTWDEKQREQIDRIVNFSLNNRAMVTIQFGQLPINQVYALRPKRQYPNKYYYAAMQIMFKLMGAKDVQ